ncbi:hypothetical protein BC831DRAFT_459658, partial [Entophlyctis helioformis]
TCSPLAWHERAQPSAVAQQSICQGCGRPRGHCIQDSKACRSNVKLAREPFGICAAMRTARHS